MSKLKEFIVCSGCGQPTPGAEGLHFQGLLRDGFRGAVLGDGDPESEYFFCSLECLESYVNASSPGAPLTGAVGVKDTVTPLPGERIPVAEEGEDNDWAEGRKPVRLTGPPGIAEPSVSPIPSVPPPSTRTVVPKRTVVKKVATSPKTPPSPKPRKLFQSEEPVGYVLPKGLPNSGKPPAELAAFTSLPDGIGDMASQVEARLRRQIPPTPKE